MRYKLAILLNGIAQLEYDREVALVAKQADYLEKMDQQMAKGVRLGDETIDTPELEQQAQFVASNLYHAIRADNESAAAAMCSWLAVRIPELKQVQMSDVQGDVKGDVSIELVYDKVYQSQVGVSFDA